MKKATFSSDFKSCAVSVELELSLKGVVIPEASSQFSAGPPFLPPFPDVKFYG